MSFSEFYDSAKRRLAKLSVWFSDHYHLLFRSAADNHLRIHQCHENPDGSVQCDINFASYTDLKKYQKKLRRMTVSLSSAVAMVVVAFIVAPYVMNPSRSSASTFLWVQNSWMGAGTGATKQYPGDNSGVTDYTSKNANIVTDGSNHVTLGAPNAANVQDSVYVTADITNKNPGFYLKDGALKLLKPGGAGCGAAGDGIGSGECRSAVCDASNLCELPCGQLVVSRTDGGTTLTYGTVVGPYGQCWLDRNLGATQIATVYNDSANYGWFFQWGRGADGHQIKTSATTTTLSSTDIVPSPNDVKFITTSTIPYDWRSPQSPNAATLWAGANGGTNNPCPTGFRLPTQPDWSALVAGMGITNSATAFSSPLKLTAAGSRNGSGALFNQGSLGYYWSSSPIGATAHYLYFSSAGVPPASNTYRSNGYSVRCVKN